MNSYVDSRCLQGSAGDDPASGDDLVAIAAGHAVLAATLGAHEYWLTHRDQELGDITHRILRLLVPNDEPAGAT